MTTEKREELRLLASWLKINTEPELFGIQDTLEFYGSIVQESKAIEAFQSLTRAVVTHRNQGNQQSLDTLKQAILEAHFFVNTLLVIYNIQGELYDLTLGERLLDMTYYKSKELVSSKELLNKIEP